MPSVTPVRVAFLRAVNVGGTGKLVMADLARLAAEAGLDQPRTHLASGNLLFSGDLTDAEVVARLGGALAQHIGRAPGLILRSGAELAALCASLPFAEEPGNRVGILFLDRPATQADVVPSHQTDERIMGGGAQVVIHYPRGMGKSRLRLPAFDHGTMRNRNTVQALARIAAQNSDS